MIFCSVYIENISLCVLPTQPLLLANTLNIAKRTQIIHIRAENVILHLSDITPGMAVGRVLEAVQQAVHHTYTFSMLQGIFVAYTDP